MSAIVRREQFIDALLGLRSAASSMSDDAHATYWVDSGAEFVGDFHLRMLEDRCDQVEQRIAAFRLELQAQRSRVRPAPIDVDHAVTF